MNRQFATELGARIRKYRKKKRWSQKTAAENMGVQRTSINRWENGRQVPSWSAMTKLRDHLGLPIGSDEDADATAERRSYQLLLPFDQVIEVHLKVLPKSADAVQFEVQFRDFAS